MEDPQAIRVLVTDDSAFTRALISDCLSGCPDIEIAGVARNGEEALLKVRRLLPDVVTLDVEMPLLNGIETLDRLMKETPLPVIMLSSLTTRGAETTIRCLEIGAFDFIEKPAKSNGNDLETFRRCLIEKVRSAGRSRLLRRMQAKSRPVQETRQKAEESFVPSRIRPDIVLVAASTGGPRALSRVLADLPKDFPCPILIVQHMPKGFTGPFAGRLDQVSPLRVLEAYEGFQPAPGTAALAPGDSHLLLKGTKEKLVCCLSETAPVNSVRPSADVLFQSAARIDGLYPAAVILTGMGRDGTEGARVLKKLNGVIFAEAEESATVYGMPRCAREAGVVDRMIPLEQIAAELIRLAGAEKPLA